MNCRLKHILLAFAVSFPFAVYCQDGKIIEKKSYTLPDSIIRSVPEGEALRQAVDFYRITYLSDGLKVKGYMAVPRQAGNYPCIIYNRGGNQEFGAITDETFVRSLGPLAKAGYVVAGSQYRGNAGGEGKEEFGGRDVNDVLNLIPLFVNEQKADTSRIGMFGWSRGGMMTYIALTKTNHIKAAVVGSGLSDLVKTLESRPGFDSLWATLIPGYASQKEKLLKERSATWLAKHISKTTPILILQGTADWRVPTDQVLDLSMKFYEVKQPFRFILYEGGQHSLVEFREEYYTEIINWFHTYLRDRKPWPNLEPHGN